ncbi:uncharacterized protein LOC114298091 [Camellia sinensis]|uniref:Uncharacterized protein n=1 Tax=Camellia sinensis var. sinensis TaxID=542762 RepID=A0A4S4E6P3_CAMSN|nr:uncharacterized protein LOC114298091 [Camellia sinensis]THG11055.1 hypothetical protein TEA_023386 [Camellia sinensis var. sinensis]
MQKGKVLSNPLKEKFKGRNVSKELEGYPIITLRFNHHNGFGVRLVGETETKISSVISEYTQTRAGGADNLIGSLNAHVPPDDAPEDPHANAMPSTKQPQYWTKCLAMEEKRHNQHVQWEQQMANQVSSLNTQYDAFATV